MNFNDLKNGDMVTILKFVGVCILAVAAIACLVFALYYVFERKSTGAGKWVRFAFCVVVLVGCVVGIVFLLR